MLVNILALVWGGAMLINFMWHRVATNPKPDETDGLLDFGIDFLNKIPILWSVLGVVLIVGGDRTTGSRRSRSQSPSPETARSRMQPKLAFRCAGALAQPAWAQIEAQLAERIESGGLQPGERLPPERELARALGVAG